MPSELERVSAVAAAGEGFGLVVLRFEPVSSWNSTVFRAYTATASYAVRSHLPGVRPAGEVRRELRFLRHLRAHGLAVPEPVVSCDGGDLLSSSGPGRSERHYDVTTWIPGEVRRRGLLPAAAYRLGSTAAGIHLAARSFDTGDGPSASPTDPPWSPSDAAVQSVAGWFSPEDRAFLQQAVDRIRPALSRVEGLEPDVGQLHGDFILGNCLWHGDALGVVDFADCHTGPFPYDLATMLTNIGDELPLRASFLAGYRSRRTLSVAQEADLPLLEAVRHINFCLDIIATSRAGRVTPPLEVHLPARIAEIRRLLPRC